MKNLTNELRKYLNNSSEQDNDQSRLKQINSLLLFSGMLIKINNHNEAVRQIRKILELLDKTLEKNNNKNIQYNFSMFIFNCLISEKLLYLLSIIADKSELKKSKMVIFINLLDLSPIYNSRLRLFILGDLYKFCDETCTNLKKRLSKKDLMDISSNEIYITMMLSRQKIRSLYFSSCENKKNVILLFDLNFPILKDINFLEKFKKYFLKKNKHKNDFYISFFDERLFIFSDLKIFENEEIENNPNTKRNQKEIGNFINLENEINPMDLINKYEQNQDNIISESK